MVEARQARLRTLTRDQAVAFSVAMNDPKKLDEVLPPASTQGQDPAAEPMAGVEEKWW